MGTVYAARLESSLGVGRIVALKVLKSEVAGANVLPSFLDEARITARLDHPNVVATLELGADQGTPFIVMEFVRGVSLKELLKRLQASNTHMDPALGALIVARAARGLHAAHELGGANGEPLGLVHRDISPDNILLSYDGSVRVTDFGIAKLATSEQTREGVIKGKFAYMSPEQVSGQELDRRSDIFSLGVVLWETLTQRRLFRRSTPRETVAAILSGKVEPPTSESAPIPSALTEITMRCLEARACDRPETAAVLESELRSAIRAGATAVDDADVAVLVGGLFANEQRELDRTLAEAEGLSPLGAETACDPLDTSQSAAGLSLESSSSAHRGGARWVALAIGLALAAGAGLMIVRPFLESTPRLRSAFANAPPAKITLEPAASAPALAPLQASAAPPTSATASTRARVAPAPRSRAKDSTDPMFEKL